MSHNLSRFFLCLALAAVAWRAFAADPVAEALEGAWLVSVAGEARERFMLVSGAKAERGKVGIESARYGWLDGRGAAIRNWEAEIAGDTIALRFVTPSDSLVDVRIRTDETTVAGTIRYTSGREREVRMTHLPPEELEALRQAAKLTKTQKPALQGPHAKRDSRIYLLYVGAPDCPSCRGYEVEYFGRKDLMAQVVPDFRELTYVKSELVSYSSRVVVGPVPAELAWLAQPGPSGKPVLKRRGVPFFALVVDDKVWAQGHGTVALESLVAPQIKRAMSEKRH